MGLAAAGYVLWTRVLKHIPLDPAWPDRDRFVFSAGHASAMLCSLLHLWGCDLPLYDFQKGSYDGRNLRFGVREHAMGAILSGIALHKGLRPCGGTFLVFADYMRPAIRLAALRGCASSARRTQSKPSRPGSPWAGNAKRAPAGLLSA